MDRDAGVIHQDIQFTGYLAHLFQHTLPCLLVTDVQFPGEALHAALDNGASHITGGAVVNISDCHIGAFACQA